MGSNFFIRSRTADTKNIMCRYIVYSNIHNVRATPTPLLLIWKSLSESCLAHNQRPTDDSCCHMFGEISHSIEERAQ